MAPRAGGPGGTPWAAGAWGVAGAQAGGEGTEEAALPGAQSGTHGWVDSVLPPGVPGSVGIGVGTEGAAAAKDERAGASIGEAGEGVHGERFVFIPNTVAVLGIGDGALFAFVEVKLYGAFLFFEGFAQYGGNAFVIVHDFNGRL